MGLELVQGHALCVHVMTGPGCLWCENSQLLFVFPEDMLERIHVPENNSLLSVAVIASINRALHLLERPKAQAYVWIREERIWEYLSKRAVEHGTLVRAKAEAKKAAKTAKEEAK